MPETPQPTHYPRVHASFRTQAEADEALSYLEGEAIPRAQLAVQHADAQPRATAREETVIPKETDEPLRDDEERNIRILRTSTAGVAAAFAAAGAVVATGGAALPAVAAGVAAGAGAGALSEGAARSAGTQGEAQTDHAGLIVVVTPMNADQSERAKGILRKVSATRVWEE
ncbi:hypothetical protein ACE7GA_06540 [Roseomonas sp. CCTCC AB2023176]|uniref:hypothetical protein n=1 Tax=Roseomonas sp. CCTCC AB2023176 TaxID=3342640 RepID=UPI0035E25460